MIKKNNSLLDDDFISLNDPDFKEIHICESGIDDSYSDSSIPHFKTTEEAVKYLKSNDITSYLLCICCKKG